VKKGKNRDSLWLKILTYNKKFILQKVRNYGSDNNSLTEWLLEISFYFFMERF